MEPLAQGLRRPAQHLSPEASGSDSEERERCVVRFRFQRLGQRIQRFGHGIASLEADLVLEMDKSFSTSLSPPRYPQRLSPEL
ncbi:hypothetical protein RchiOBHm_Chr5g0078021 [Rosa chinensis]|uniref:Uncharacterized protein n=1 Tax=Rosa chinensis TaxID=74649 RepID=A0A2P6QM70_ROSCH|nr:hypothetical protein RchiOBHm_Chr5g0078021 [Rosa chinensis]